MGRKGDMHLSWWLILLLVWLAPAALASLGMLWCGWVAPALVGPRKPSAPEIAADPPPQICRPSEPAHDETAEGDQLHRPIRLPEPPQAPGTPRMSHAACVEHASA